MLFLLCVCVRGEYLEMSVEDVELYTAHTFSHHCSCQREDGKHTKAATQEGRRQRQGNKTVCEK